MHHPTVLESSQSHDIASTIHFSYLMSMGGPTCLPHIASKCCHPIPCGYLLLGILQGIWQAGGGKCEGTDIDRKPLHHCQQGNSVLKVLYLKVINPCYNCSLCTAWKRCSLIPTARLFIKGWYVYLLLVLYSCVIQHE